MIIIPSNSAKLAPVAYVSTGTGASDTYGDATTTNTHNIASVADAYLVMFVMSYTSSWGTIYVGSTPMTALVPSVYWDDGGAYTMCAYGLANPPTGNQSITFNGNANTLSFNSVLYSGVKSVTTSAVSSNTVNPYDVAWSYPVTCPNDGYVVHGYGTLHGSSSLSGGANRFNTTGAAGLNISDSNISTTFSGNKSSGRGYYSIKLFLSNS